MKCCTLIVLFSPLAVNAFTSTSTTVGINLFNSVNSKLTLLEKRSDTVETPRRRRVCSKCQDDDDDDDDDNSDLSRRESLFAMLGSLMASMSVPAAASATYGADAKMELPNPIEALANRQNGQCLVESLGNRDCLVYLDPANKLYQGADSRVLLERIEKSSQALASVPLLIEQKKWSQVSGVLLGPLGTMVETMNLLIQSSENGSAAADYARKTKSELNNIFQATQRKDGGKALAAHEGATRNLVAFVKSL